MPRHNVTVPSDQPKDNSGTVNAGLAAAREGLYRGALDNAGTSRQTMQDFVADDRVRKAGVVASRAKSAQAMRQR